MKPEIDACHALLRSATRSFRLGCDAQGNESFVELIDGIGELLGGSLDADRAESITALFPEIIAAQSRGDTLTIADLLEHEVGPRLG